MKWCLEMISGSWREYAKNPAMWLVQEDMNTHKRLCLWHETTVWCNVTWMDRWAMKQLSDDTKNDSIRDYWLKRQIYTMVLETMVAALPVKIRKHDDTRHTWIQTIVGFISKAVHYNSLQSIITQPWNLLVLHRQHCHERSMVEWTLLVYVTKSILTRHETNFTTEKQRKWVMDVSCFSNCKIFIQQTHWNDTRFLVSRNQTWKHSFASTHDSGVGNWRTFVYNHTVVGQFN